MTWFGWVLLSFFAVGSLINISMIGKPREPTTPGVAMATLIINTMLIIGVLMVGTNHRV